ncbi:hypothetical protein C8A05DRAFT_36483 [Staphylotrichum tortipilum]|uniref:non-specific serine/threonine protein kinase n=1 Tax=Staphylotrichum tortipilum TaxID=2831512 RepID=A0AAN6MGW6_9PEZI|nr:hypothetical protein C8A05DRAFT_36483 [Staphylotrichum longicolle]
MLRRPPGHVAPQSAKYLLALALILLPWFPLADAQQQHQQQHQQHHAQHQRLASSPEDDQHPAPNLAATPVPAAQETVEAPLIHQRRKTTVAHGIDDDRVQRILAARHNGNNGDGDADTHRHNNIQHTFIPADARAAYALAPELSVRAQPPSHNRGPSPGGAGLSQHVARSLEDWEVEDFVLLATVDGDLYASDRKTGQERWRFRADHPMVETTHFRTNRSVVDDDYRPIDHYIWVVEPTRDGELYLWRPNQHGAGLAKMALTMKKLVEVLSPYNDQDNGVMYTGDKKTTMITLNAATGTILKQFGSTGSYVNRVDSESCFRPHALADGDDDECSEDSTITLGRTEYTVSIQHSDGSPIASLKYSEWGPNTRDGDLIQQNSASKDSRYITGQHDGKVYGFEFSSFTGQRPVFTKTLASPVARVFDVLHRWDSAGSGVDPELIALPQPLLPIGDDDDNARGRSEKVFINQTEEGSWYALSGTRYPLVLSAPVAPIHRGDWWRIKESWDLLPEAQKSRALIGIHQLPAGITQSDTVSESTQLLGLDPPLAEPDPPLTGHGDLPTVPHPPGREPTTILGTAKKVPGFVVTRIFDLVSNPAAIVLFCVTLYYLYKDRLRSSARKSKDQSVSWPPLEVNTTLSRPDSPKVDEPLPDVTVSSGSSVPGETPPEAVPDAAAVAAIETSVESTSEAAPAARQRSPTVTFADQPELPAQPAAEGSNADGAVVGANGEAAPVGETPKKKKGHRGRRGGVKHRKGNKEKRENSQSRDDESQEEAVEEMVYKPNALFPDPRIEPDIMTGPDTGSELSGQVLKMGSLEVNESEQLGTGSNGTIVFAGKWDGRDVAVKRMLVQFNEIASQETRLLRESDDHPNVIRYYAQQERASFLYIALELCQASLADVVQKPSAFRELAQAGERDMPSVLYQIANGLSHLHSLRIVHRDLKPQNILVNMGKNGRPRILVSDFGLCKKLEGGQSSFGATTAHAAGTTGWRAPELLIDDGEPLPTAMSLTDPGSSMPSVSGSGMVEGPGPHSRRVTRAIDIFSLGLVFYYVLTRGNHPFDCGGRFMREVNIRNKAYNLDLLDALGDFAFEARDLIASMISHNPRQRPAALEVMAHPFFWSFKKRLNFLCDVSDHFEKEPRDPPSPALAHLENHAEEVVRGDFLRHLPREFVDSLGKQRKYTGGRLLDLLRALRNKRNHYEDMPETLKKTVGPLPDGYLTFWAGRFPNLLVVCWNVVYDLHWEEGDRFRDYYVPAPPSSL